MSWVCETLLSDKQQLLSVTVQRQLLIGNVMGLYLNDFEVDCLNEAVGIWNAEAVMDQTKPSKNICYKCIVLHFSAQNTMILDNYYSS